MSSKWVREGSGEMLIRKRSGRHSSHPVKEDGSKSEALSLTKVKCVSTLYLTVPTLVKVDKRPPDRFLSFEITYFTKQ